MKVRKLKGEAKDYTGALIDLSGNEVARAIDAYIVARGVSVSGPRTISINGEICSNCAAQVWVDPSGFVIAEGQRF